MGDEGARQDQLHTFGALCKMRRRAPWLKNYSEFQDGNS